jgi:hypothetical protein
MGLIARLDRSLKPWHVATANFASLLWFAGVTIFGRAAVPSVALFRCPVGFCAGGYPPEELYSMLDDIGEEGRRYIHDSMLRGDLVLPMLILTALVLDILWFSRPGARMSVTLQPMARLGLLGVPVLYFIVDYLENAAIAQMLRVYPDLEDVMAERASLLTAAKSQLFAASAGIALALAVAAWGTEMRARAHRSGDDR